MSYREQPPPPRFAAYLECFWNLEVRRRHPAYPVLPDGCVDIVFSSADEPRVVGTMTRPQYFDLPVGRFVCGIRFRPGRACALLGIPAWLLTDRSIALADLPPLQQPPALDAFSRLIDWVVERRGDVRINDLARHSGLSVRQLQRRFLDETGVGPKQFCRILRFRRAQSLLAATRGDWAGLAAECGYFDQAHLIRDFRDLAGRNPSRLVSDFSNR